ncbi:MAG: S26 family signal peptidase [Hyphomicrobiaceae bacterium]
MLGLSVLAVASPWASHPRLLWNTSPSVPVGLYWIADAAPTTGELAVIRLPDALRTLGAARGYLGLTALLIKPVATGLGDVVCRHGATLTINGKPAADARMADERGRPLLHWSGCTTLAAGQVFVLSAAPDSFDGRYFGAIDRSQVLGAARPVWVNQHDGPSPRQRGPP